MRMARLSLNNSRLSDSLPMPNALRRREAHDLQIKTNVWNQFQKTKQLPSRRTATNVPTRQRRLSSRRTANNVLSRQNGHRALALPIRQQRAMQAARSFVNLLASKALRCCRFRICHALAYFFLRRCRSERTLERIYGGGGICKRQTAPVV